MVERNSVSKNRKTILNMDTLNAPLFNQNTIAINHDANHNNNHESVVISKNSNRNKSQSQTQLK